MGPRPRVDFVRHELPDFVSYPAFHTSPVPIWENTLPLASQSPKNSGGPHFSIPIGIPDRESWLLVSRYVFMFKYIYKCVVGQSRWWVLTQGTLKHTEPPPLPGLYTFCGHITGSPSNTRPPPSSSRAPCTGCATRISLYAPSPSAAPTSFGNARHDKTQTSGGTHPVSSGQIPRRGAVPASASASCGARGNPARACRAARVADRKSVV